MIRATLAATGAALLLATGPLPAHGGLYRGPGDTVPPHTGGPSGPPTRPDQPLPPGGNTPREPSQPGIPNGPYTGQPQRPLAPPTGTGIGRTSTTRNSTWSPPAYDLTNWDFWWEFNKDRYLRLKDHLSRMRTRTGGGLLDEIKGSSHRRKVKIKPSVTELRRACGSLRRALEERGNIDMISAVLIALAKIGVDHELGGLFREYIRHDNQEVSETALLSCGIAGLDSSAGDLVEVFLDSDKGRRLVDQSEVGYRRRAFAGYSLALLANRTGDLVVKKRVFAAARKVLDRAQRIRRRDILVSALVAIRLLRPDLSTIQGRALAAEVGRYLLDMFQQNGRMHQVRAHVPTALARILEGYTPRPGDGRESGDPLVRIHRQALTCFGKVLGNRGENHMVRQSAVLALGQMGSPSDQALVRLLQETTDRRRCKDIQSRHFAFISLGQLGGSAARSFLMTRLHGRGRKSEKPWIALGLGLIADRQARLRQADPELVTCLISAFSGTRNPEWKAGLAIAIGLTRSTPAGVHLQLAMKSTRSPSLQGYCAVAMGMLGYQEGLGDMRHLLANSVRKPGLLSQLSIGLGLLGDPALVDTLVARLRSGSRSLAFQASLARGLGFIGDRRAVPQLVDMIFNLGIAPLSRAFAAGALGGVGDKDTFPWTSRIARGLNYRANVETLTGSTTGVLDLL